MTTHVSLPVNGAGRFEQVVRRATGDALRAGSLRTVQVNIGLRCNMACRHCHVESSPGRDEEMDWPTMELVLDAASRAGAGTLDITGGAPEMHPHFRAFVTLARRQGLHVIVRTNLTILLQPDFEDLPGFLAGHGVELVASLPCYLADNVDRQRGAQAYDGSIGALRRLNAVGYGVEPSRPLVLVYNPIGPSLPPPTAALEADYRRELRERFDIRFTRLISITNLPIGRFLHDLTREGRAEDYAQRLEGAFNADNLPGLMCRHQLHVAHDGRMYDCDFNYALGLPVAGAAGRHLRDFDPGRHRRRPIVTGRHCFGCTAGHGSSCGGALS